MLVPSRSLVFWRMLFLAWFRVLFSSEGLSQAVSKAERARTSLMGEFWGSLKRPSATAARSRSEKEWTATPWMNLSHSLM